jgi:hypothetical protein
MTPTKRCLKIVYPDFDYELVCLDCWQQDPSLPIPNFEYDKHSCPIEFLVECCDLCGERFWESRKPFTKEILERNLRLVAEAKARLENHG